MCLSRLTQGFPEAYTEDCWPVRLPGLQGHACRPCSRADVEERERLRFALLGNAVTVDVARWLGGRLMRLYECAAPPPPARIPNQPDSTLYFLCSQFVIPAGKAQSDAWLERRRN